ncbi:DUF1223 domain-containing protein [Fulvivirgaceae bacterium PWU5]|uniref:DUF1223 domain-containing protein n=1 Tax=Dawidia cretensis TaxID=2782350 RepID=A0AAP2GNV5_9BACT|nr:DUF1223 domain-containing protein [Dawidia cretensis]MBT1707609.1 DUF1223 domain-containing protein [Dawidia cretensis]
MKSTNAIIIGVGIALIAFLAAFTTPPATTVKHTVPATGVRGFALLELFTSEGCSSCPRADDLLAKVQTEAKGQAIYVLAYHVDYWDRLGWKDKFSNALFSERQRTYAGHLQSGSVYTPQIVINGNKECLDWNASTLQENISNALTTAADATLDLHVIQNNRSLTVKYQATGKTDANQLLIALVQKHAVNKISRGENEGRMLTHAQIVRVLTTVNLNAGLQGTNVIEAPSDFTGNGWEIVGFLQNTNNGAITAATSTPLNN